MPGYWRAADVDAWSDRIAREMQEGLDEMISAADLKFDLEPIDLGDSNDFDIFDRPRRTRRAS